MTEMSGVDVELVISSQPLASGNLGFEPSQHLSGGARCESHPT